MKIIDVKVMRGPNYWSVSHHKLITMKLDIGAYKNVSTGAIRELNNRMARLIPSITSPHLKKSDAGTEQHDNPLIGLVGQLALELQQMAGPESTFGSSYSLGGGIYKVVFSYNAELAGIYAGEAAIECVNALLEKREFNLLEAIEKIKVLQRREAFGPSTQSIVDEAVSRGIPYIRMDEQSLIQLGHGCKQKIFQATVVETTSNLAVEMVANKWLTKAILEKFGIPVPTGIIVENAMELKEAIEKIGFPLVIKPIDGNHGRGITADITSYEDALKGLEAAQAISDKVLIENYIQGDDYRFLVIDYKLVAVARRTPAMVIGDGVSTVRQLVDEVNADPARGADHEQILTFIKLDEHTMDVLEDAGLTIDSVVPKGKTVYLKRTANLSTGGTATDATDTVHPDNIFMAERIARLMRLDICGIDIMARDVSAPISSGNGAIIEVNAGPGFRMHTHPSEGKPRNVAGPVIDMLFPEGNNGRIPIIAVTGTNGKTTTTRLIAHIAKYAGKCAGYTTTDGIYINDRLVYKGDCSGPKSAALVLGDPTVNFAVLESARGGILRSGLAFDQCDVSIVTNLSEDHLGLGDIHTMEQYARVKAVVPKSTSPDGFAILNADDDFVYGMRADLPCRVILFSTDSSSARIAAHCARGGLAVAIENGNYVIYHGPEKTTVIAVNDIPLTYSGTAEFMVKNILPAIAASIASGFGPEIIRESLKAFEASPESTPGRMNLFDFGDFRLMLDYAHNAAGFLEVEKYMKTVNAKKKIGIIAATGDRKNEDIFNQGMYAARIFDEVIIRHDKDSRGRNNDELTELLKQGIHSVDAGKPITVISDEYEAMKFAIDRAETDAFIFACADNVWNSISLIENLQAAINH